MIIHYDSDGSHDLSYIDMIIWSSNQPLCRFEGLLSTSTSNYQDRTQDSATQTHTTTVPAPFFVPIFDTGFTLEDDVPLCWMSYCTLESEVDAILYLQGLSKYEVDLNQKGTYVIEFHSFDFRCMFFQMVLNETVWH